MFFHFLRLHFSYQFVMMKKITKEWFYYEKHPH